MHVSRQWNCWPLSCSWSTTCFRCFNYIFILDLTPGFKWIRQRQLHDGMRNLYVFGFDAPTIYPKKYSHGFCFAVLCCGSTLTDFPISIRLTSLALWQSNDCPSASKATLMNMDKYFMWIHYERLYNHNKAKHNKTVCIFLGIYCKMTWCIVWDILWDIIEKWWASVMIQLINVVVLVKPHVKALQQSLVLPYSSFWCTLNKLWAFICPCQCISFTVGTFPGSVFISVNVNKQYLWRT